MAPGRVKRMTISAIKLVIAVVVLWAVGRHVIRVMGGLREKGESLRFSPGWLAIAGILYLTGLGACGVYYHRVLQATAGPIGLFAASRAYLISHLGKYVPGKAMVVVLRVGLSTPYGASATAATVATFYETLVMMASGCVIAAGGFALFSGPASVGFISPRWVRGVIPTEHLTWLVSLALGLGFLVVTAPPVFGQTARLIRKSLAGARPEPPPPISWRLMGEGLLLSGVGWILLGLSQLAVIWSFDEEAKAASLSLLPLVTAGVAFATAAGFVVAVLPGGLGVREGVLMSVLAPALGADRSVVAALALRLVWVAAEVLAALLLAPWIKPHTRLTPHDPASNPSTP